MRRLCSCPPFLRVADRRGHRTRGIPGPLVSYKDLVRVRRELDVGPKSQGFSGCTHVVNAVTLEAGPSKPHLFDRPTPRTGTTYLEAIMTQPPQPSRRDRSGGAEEAALQVKAALVKEALADPAFRRLALSDPAAAVRRSRFLSDAEQALAADFQVSVVEETADLLYLVIPATADPRHFNPSNPKDLLVAKAVTDEDYLERLTGDPRSVIESEFQVEVPPGFAVKVLRESSRRLVAVLPADLRPEQLAWVPDELLEYQSAAWGGGGGGCGGRTFLGSIIENLCQPGPDGPNGPPPHTVVEGPGCPAEPL